MRETRPRVILDSKAARLRASTGNPDLPSKLFRTTAPRQVLYQAFVRLVMLLFRSLIILVMSLYVALISA